MFPGQTSFADLLAVGVTFRRSTDRLQMFGLYTTIQARLRGWLNRAHEESKEQDE